MIIHLPEDLESSIRAQVQSGHFASMDAAMAEAARLLLRELDETHRPALAVESEATTDPVLGSMKDAAEELDEIVAEAMRIRQEQPWRVFPDE
jgi:Arc/MetJ-type ribon-helix-helix transcriptional regulator